MHRVVIPDDITERVIHHCGRAHVYDEFDPRRAALLCCESSARDAMMLNFRTITVTDANAAMSDEDHNISLRAFYLSFGDIPSTDQIGFSSRTESEPWLMPPAPWRSSR